MKTLFTLARLVCVATIFISFASCSVHKENELMGDFDYFFSQLESVHPDPYSAFGGKRKFHRKVSKLRRELNSLDSLSAQTLQEHISCFLVPLHDGHSYCGWQQIRPKDNLRVLPFSFRVTKDGFMIYVALEEYSKLIGAQLISINGKNLDYLMDRYAELTIAENKYSLFDKACYSQFNSAFLDYISLDYDWRNVAIGLKLPSAIDTTIYLRMRKMEEVKQSKIVLAPTDRRFPRKNLQYEWVDDNKNIMCFKCTSVLSRDCLELMRDNGMDYESLKDRVWEGSSLEDVPSMTESFGEMLCEMKEAKAHTLIIDLRGNGGGWTPIVYPTLYQLFGDEYLRMDMGISYKTKLSPLYLSKNNTTIEEYNAQNKSNYKYGDFVNDMTQAVTKSLDSEKRKEIIDSYISCDKESLLMQEGKPLYCPKNIYVVTNAATFSAAFHFAFMLWKMGATLVGVPSGQSPNCFMEETPFVLPISGISCSVSNAIQEIFPKDNPRANVLWPDIMLSANDYKNLNFDTNAELLYILGLAEVDIV